MMMKISNLWGRTYFKTYSELSFILSIAKVARLFDCTVDLSDFTVDRNLVSSEDYELYENFIKAGLIWVGGEKKEFQGVIKEVSYFTSEKMYSVEGNIAKWSFEYADRSYSKKNLHSFKFPVIELSHSFMNLIAFYIVRRLLGLDNTSHLEVTISNTWSENYFIYLDLYACMKALPWLDEMVSMSIEYKNNTSVDVDYEVFCKESQIFKRYGKYSFSEKRCLMEKCGFVTGGIYLMIHRGRISDQHKCGFVQSIKLIRLDEICRDSIGYTEISVNKTKEEVNEDYLDIDADMRVLYSDLLFKKPYIRYSVDSLASVGIDEYFFDEDFILTKIDWYATIEKLVTIDGVKSRVLMSEVDAIYWLLMQYGIDFDPDVYKEIYSQGKELMYDRYNSES